MVSFAFDMYSFITAQVYNCLALPVYPKSLMPLHEGEGVQEGKVIREMLVWLGTLS